MRAAEPKRSSRRRTSVDEAQLTWLGFKLVRFLVGNYTTSLEMAGASLTVTVLDSELKSLWDAPVHTAALRW